MGGWSKPFYLWTSSGFNSPVYDKMTLCICLGIFVFFLINCICLWKQSRKVLDVLSNLLRFQEKKTDSIKAINNFLLSEKRPLSELWSLNKENWVFPEGHQVKIFKRERFSTVSSTEYFNPQNCIDVQINMEWFQSLPSILTGLGIFFTFIGLAMALPYLQSISENARQGFFSSAAVAFWSSVIGLACSILFSWQLRATKQRLLRKIDAFSNKLDETIPVLTLQKISLISLLNLQSHTTVENQINQTLSNFSQNVQNEISKLVTSITEELSRGIKERIGESAAIFSDAAKALDDSLKSANVVAENLNKNLTQGSGELTSHIKEATGYTEKFVQDLKNSLVQINAEFNEILTNFHTEQTSNVNFTFSLMKKNSEELSHLIESNIGLLKKSLTDLQVEIGTLTKNNLSELGKELKDLCDKSAQSCKETMRETIVEFKQANQEIQSGTLQTVNALSEALIKTKDTHEQLCTTMEQSSDKQFRAIQNRICLRLK